jgi:formylglycine-generating enzyme required for sulfatase activity
LSGHSCFAILSASMNRVLRRLRVVFCLCFWAVGQWANAQSPASLSVQTYAGLTITGSVGTVYTVQSKPNLEQPDWQAAGIVQLSSSPYLWVDTAAPATGRRFYRAVEGPTNMVWIPPGTFTMGSPSNEPERSNPEGPQTVVTLAQGFFMGKYEVTQGEYADVMGNNPSYFRNGVSGSCCGGIGDAVTNESRHPVERVFWHDATNYCGRVTERERAAGRLPAGWVYRLPTEAEWEYACRGGTTTAFHYGAALRSGMANFIGAQEYDSLIGTTNNPDGIFLGRTTLVGSYEANGWGLYDMHGNVWEWCFGRWSYGLPGGRVIDWQGPATGTLQVMRGGCWALRGTSCRSASRINYPDLGTYGIGFRVVLTSGER